jgi:Subtilase family
MSETEMSGYDDAEYFRRLERERGAAMLKDGDVGSIPVSKDRAELLYKQGQLLVGGPEALERVLRILRELDIPAEPSGGYDDRVGGVRVIDLPATDAEVARRLVSEIDPTVPVSVNRFLFAQQRVQWWAMGIPEPLATPPEPDVEAHEGVTVGVVDTGIQRDAPWMGAVRVLDDPADYEDPDPPPTFFEAGHGSFVASRVHQRCPEVDVFATRIDMDARGLVDELTAIGRVAALGTAGDGLDVLVMSFGSPEGGGHPVAWRAVLAQLRRHRGGRGLPPTVVVAAGGNLGVAAGLLPASLPGVIGVGALGVDGRRAPFSNYGSSVDVWAPGTDVGGAYLRQKGRFGRDFDGWATWSGTSFAAPLVAGDIACRMVRATETAREAAEFVLVAHWRLRLDGRPVVT